MMIQRRVMRRVGVNRELGLSQVNTSTLESYKKAAIAHQPMIVLFEQGADGSLLVEPCGVMPVTPDGVKTVESGLAAGKGFSALD